MNFFSGLFKLMKFIEYLKPTHKNASEVLLRSHQENFCKHLTTEELEDLQNHQKLYRKVVEELGGQTEGVEEMSSRFNNFVENNSTELLQVSKAFVKPEETNISDFKVSLFNPITWSKPLWTYDDSPPVMTTPGNDLGNILVKLSLKQSKDMFGDISKGLKDQKNSALLDKTVLDYYLEGIRNTDLTTWDRLSESIHYIAMFFKETIIVSDLSVLLEYCKTNEKFIFILLYPYLFMPLKKLLWSYLYPIFSLRIESFTFFLKKVALKIGNIIKHQNPIVNGFHHLRISKSVKYTLGTGGVSSLLLLYNNYFLKDNRAIVPLYQGMGGFVGEFANLFRVEVSKMIFEVTKTASTFTNAAVAGFLEPKQAAVRQILKNVFKK